MSQATLKTPAVFSPVLWHVHICFFICLGLQARNSTARGAAPGLWITPNPKGCKPEIKSPPVSKTFEFLFRAFSAWIHVAFRFPRASPWAVEFRPFRPWDVSPLFCERLRMSGARRSAMRRRAPAQSDLLSRGIRCVRAKMGCMQTRMTPWRSTT